MTVEAATVAGWFREQLQGLADGFVWGAMLVPDERRDVVPPAGLGEWTAARHVFHLVHYEQTIALPSMRQWLGEGKPDVSGPAEEVAWRRADRDVGRLIAAFRSVREAEIALLDAFDGDAWVSSRPTLWGPMSLGWVVTKTFQHTAEHISDVMRIALFWDMFAAQQPARGAG
jgi:hypothetical protein